MGKDIRLCVKFLLKDIPYGKHKFIGQHKLKLFTMI